MSRDLRRRDFIATATASGFVGIAGCGQSGSDTQTTGPTDPATQTTASADTGTRTPEPTESQPTTEDYLSGEAVSIFGTPLADATVRILAKPENSYTARAETQPHEELGRTTTQSDGSFQFTEFPASDFETLRQERDLVMVLFTHPDGWFTGGNYTTNLVFDSETILGRIRPVWKYVVRPTVVTDTAGRPRGTVSVWKWFLNDDPTQQRVGVEVTATNPRSDRNVYDINEGDLTLGTGSFSLEVPEQGIEVDYENVSIERAKPSGDIISAKPGTEEPSKAIKKWHPARSVDGLELGVPARFMTRDLFTELTEEDIERAEEKRKVVNFVLGATPVVGDVMQLISAMQIVFDLFDAGETTDPSQWPSIGNALDRTVDRNESDVVTAGVNQNVVSAVMTVPYRITDESSHELAVRGLWQGDFGEGRIGQRVSATATESDSDTEDPSIDEDWPQFQLDRLNTGYSSGSSGPINNITERWTFETDGSPRNPVVANGTIYVGTTGGTVYAIEASSGDQEWVFNGPDQIVGTPAVANDTVYINSRDNNVYAIDAVTGELQWRFTPGDIVASSPTVVNDTVYFGSHADKVHALDANDGTELWSFDRPDWEVRTTPAVANGTVYVGSHDSHVYAIDAETGNHQWTFQAGTRVYSPPAVVNETVYTASRDHNVYALDANTGEELWSFDTGAWVHASPAVADGSVYIGDHGRGGPNHLYALDAEDGTEQWSFEIGDQFAQAAAVVNDTVYFGCKDYNMYALDATTGDRQWIYQTGDQVRTSPAVVSGTIYFGSQDGNLYALAEE